MKQTILFLVLLLAIACNRKNDDTPVQYKPVELNEQNCVFRIEPRAHLDKVSGVVSFSQSDVSWSSILVLKTAAGKLYTPCYIPKEYQRQGLRVIFSGSVYGPDPATMYNPNMETVFVAGGILKLSELRVEEK